MKILAIIPHYYGIPPTGSQYRQRDPIARIAALNETIVALHRNFGPFRSTFEGKDLDEGQDGTINFIDIVIITHRDRNVLSSIGVAPSLYSVEYIDDTPTRIPFHAQKLLKEKVGKYDFYCVLEDDMAIHDPSFFEKLLWFQKLFGYRALLAPTRVETSFSQSIGKIICDPILSMNFLHPFRRAGQRNEVRGMWHDAEKVFRLPENPHAGSYFLTNEQVEYWISQPTFDNGDQSWVGPLESALTLGTGHVFDVYKSAFPNPFFLEIHHYGTQYAVLNSPPGRHYAGSPLLRLAQDGVRNIVQRDSAGTALSNSILPESLLENFYRVDAQSSERDNQLLYKSKSLRWLWQSLLAELYRRAVVFKNQLLRSPQ
jgi:hypothetical protein